MGGRHAGGSAEAVARRTREKIARLEQSAVRWEAGAAGERAVGEILDQLTASGWTVMHDVPWPGRSRANIDHVVVGPGGVFVVDTKNWSGQVEVRNGLLTQNGRSRERELVGVAGATLAVMQFHPRVTTYGVLCLVEDEPRREAMHDVTVCSSASLLEVVESAPTLLSPEEVASVSEELAAKLTSVQPVVEPAAGRGDEPASGANRTRSRRRPVVVLAAAAVVVAGVATGSFSRALDTVGGLVSDVVVDADTPPAQTPGKQSKKKQQAEQRKQQKPEPAGN